MPSGKDPEFKKIIRSFNRSGVRYVLFGRQAVVLHGAPMTSFDYDLWVSPADRTTVFHLMEEAGLDPTSTTAEKKPIVNFMNESLKIDIFFLKGFGRGIEFEDCFANSVIMKDGDGRFFIRVASIDDLIRLKSFRNTLRQKDREDIKYLKELKKREVK